VEMQPASSSAVIVLSAYGHLLYSSAIFLGFEPETTIAALRA